MTKTSAASAFMLAFAAWLVLPPLQAPGGSDAGPAQPANGSGDAQPADSPEDTSLDDALLKSLLEDDEEAQPDVRHAPNTAAENPTGKNDSEGKGPAGQGQQKQQVEAGAKDAAQPDQTKEQPLNDLDRQLLEGLGEDFSPTAEGEASEDPIFRLNRLMREVEERIARQGADQEVLDRQQKIADELARLIRELQKQRQQQGRSSASRSSGRRQRVQQPGQPSGRQSAQDVPARESADKLRERQAGKPDSRQLEELFKDVWGNLPEKERERLMQSYREEFLEAYRLEIEAYFNALVKRRFGGR